MQAWSQGVCTRNSQCSSVRALQTWLLGCQSCKLMSYTCASQAWQSAAFQLTIACMKESYRLCAWLSGIQHFCYPFSSFAAPSPSLLPCCGPLAPPTSCCLTLMYACRAAQGPVSSSDALLQHAVPSGYAAQSVNFGTGTTVQQASSNNDHYSKVCHLQQLDHTDITIGLLRKLHAA